MRLLLFVHTFYLPAKLNASGMKNLPRIQQIGSVKLPAFDLYLSTLNSILFSKDYRAGQGDFLVHEIAALN